MEPLRIETTDGVRDLKTPNAVQQDTSPKVDTDIEIFEPDYTTKKLWLATRKDPYNQPGTENQSGIYLPGLYQTSDTRLDKILFTIALVIEAIAFYIIISGGLSSSDPLNKFKAIIASLGFLVLDGFGAYFVHKMKPNICFQKNKIQADPHNKTAYEMEMAEGGIYKYIGISLIIVSSMLKVLGTVLFGHIPSLILNVILFFLYLFVIYIHVNHTGYYFSNLFFEKRWNKQHRKFSKDRVEIQSSEFAGRKLVQQMISPIAIFRENSMKSKFVGDHELIFIQEKQTNETREFHYNLITKGILEDAEILSFLDSVKSTAMAGLAKNCLHHQVFKIHTGDSRRKAITKRK